MRSVDGLIAIAGIALTLFGVWLLRNPATLDEGWGAIFVGVILVGGAVVKIWRRSPWGVRILGRVPPRLRAFIGAAFWAVVAFLVLLPPGEFTVLWGAATVLVVGPLALTALLRLWRDPQSNRVQQLGDALVIESPGRRSSLLKGLWSLSLSVGCGLAAYMFIQSPEREWDDWPAIIGAPIFAIGFAPGAVYNLIMALVPTGRLRLDAAGVHSADRNDSILWSEIVAAELKSTEIVLKLRPPPDSVVGNVSKEVRITVPGELTDDDEAAIRAFLESQAAA